mmetsp:Transcript_4180/g.9808  ORF Transcript_4180/g.9808 Transcript_4180/m.9808 type:complete len:201 (+) Transcript_4180:2191-2793(+)
MLVVLFCCTVQGKYSRLRMNRSGVTDISWETSLPVPPPPNSFSLTFLGLCFSSSSSCKEPSEGFPPCSTMTTAACAVSWRICFRIRSSTICGFSWCTSAAITKSSEVIMDISGASDTSILNWSSSSSSQYSLGSLASKEGFSLIGIPIPTPMPCKTCCSSSFSKSSTSTGPPYPCLLSSLLVVFIGDSDRSPRRLGPAIL